MVEGLTNTNGRSQVRLFTDGACIGNPGPGGWACILHHPVSGKRKECSGGEHATTNNRMEITAVLRGLEALKAPSHVELFSDSKYVVNAINQWMANWKRFGWKRSAKARDPVRNDDLWRQLDELLKIHSLRANWVRGHDGHPENERCDALATAAAAAVASTAAPPVASVSTRSPAQSLFESPGAAEKDEK